MKRFSEQNHYEILEISRDATWSEIQRAYEIAKKTYGREEIASYSLFDSDEREFLYEKVEEAYRTLMDHNKRRKYDEYLARGGQPVVHQETAKERVGVSSELLYPDEVNGTALKKIREKKGVSLQEIADQTRINITYLNYIEEGNFRGLPAEVFLRGYLLQYAQVIRCDTDVVVNGYLKGYREWLKQKH